MPTAATVLTNASAVLATIREDVARALREQETADLEELALVVDAGLSQVQRDAVFRYFLYRYVQDVNRGLRNSPPPPVEATEGATTGTGRVYEEGGRRFASAGVAATFSWWRRVRDGICVVDGTDRRYGSLSAEELLLLAEASEAEAAKNLATAARHRALAKAVTDSGVSTLDELDVSTARQCWGDS